MLVVGVCGWLKVGRRSINQQRDWTEAETLPDGKTLPGFGESS